MNSIKIISVVGARPNFMKIAPIYRAFNIYKDIITHKICHTGQHFDKNMSDIFFHQLGIPAPDYSLGIGGGSHAEQTGKIMIEFEKVLLIENPDLVIVVGDVNSTIACSLTAKKLHIKVAHIEAGLRSFDRQMPEEINRILTDSISDYLFVTEESGMINLKNEGINENKIFFVGNCMIDSLVNLLPIIERSKIIKQLNLSEKSYILVTMHRPSNVDSESKLKELIMFLNSIATKRKIVFPVHPRTRKNLYKFSLFETLSDNILITDPIGYIDFIKLVKDAELIITDSGGIQEESTFLGVQCITVRNSTERPSTIVQGTNQLIGENLKMVEKAAVRIINGYKKTGTIPILWDGKSAERIVNILVNQSYN